MHIGTCDQAGEVLTQSFGMRDEVVGLQKYHHLIFC